MALLQDYSCADLLDTILVAPAEHHITKRHERHNELLIIEALLRQLSTTLHCPPPPPYDAQPPGYEDTLNDCPPDYTSTDVLITSAFSKCSISGLDPYLPIYTDHKSKPRVSNPDRPHIDFSTPHNIRSHAGKKAKSAAKAAKKAQWAESGDEGEDGSKDGGGDGSNGGGDGGSAGGGAGGDDGDGAGDDWFNDTGKKNKKKGKKGKKDDEEEEEKKSDEAGAAANTDNFWDDLDSGAKAGDANPDDEWATGSKKKDKKKGKKVRTLLFVECGTRR